MKRDIKRAEKLQDYWTGNQEDLVTRFSSFGHDFKMAELFTRFKSKK